MTQGPFKYYVMPKGAGGMVKCYDVLHNRKGGTSLLRNTGLIKKKSKFQVIGRLKIKTKQEKLLISF